MAAAVAVAVAVALAVAGVAAAPQRYRVTIPTAGRVLAGIFANGSLVRQVTTGSDALVADALANTTVEVTADVAPHETLRAFLGAVAYTWEGVLGNTGPSIGPWVWRSLNPLTDLAITTAGGVSTAVFGLNYNEAQRSFGMLTRNSSDSGGSGGGGPFLPMIPLGHPDYHRTFPLVATDGVIGYFANAGIVAPNTSYYHLPVCFVVGVDLATGCEHNFTVGGREECEEGAGQPPCTKQWDGCNGGGQYWSSVLDYSHVDAVANGSLVEAPTGLAVQLETPGVLAVAHAFVGVVRLFDKTTGASWCNASASAGFTAPRSLAFGSGGLLVVVDVDGVGLYQLPSQAACQAGEPWQRLALIGADIVAMPGAVAVAPGNAIVAVADLARQQVALVDALHGGGVLAVIGTVGGYSQPNATVDGSKLWFAPTLQGGAPNETALGRGTFLAFDDGGATLWVSEPGNRRVLHFNISSLTGTAAAAAGEGAPAPAPALIEADTLMYLPTSYRSVVHPADPTRVFSNFLELAVDYSVPVAASWRLVRNWGAGLPDAFYAFDAGYGFQRWAFAGFASMGTAYGGRTFALVSYMPNAPWNTSGEAVGVVELVETPTPHVQLLQTLPKGAYYMHADASIRYTSVESDAAAGAHWQAVLSVAPTVNGSSGAVSWALPGVTIASFNVSASMSESFMARPGAEPLALPITDTGMVVLLDATTGANGGAHLGAVAVNGTTLAWTAAPWGSWEVVANKTTLQPGNVTVTVRTIVNAGGQYGANATSINYAASYPMASGANIVYGFYGEGWDQAEANQFLHHLDNGLYVGQFGAPNFPDANAVYALPGAAGNSFSPSLVVPPDGDGSVVYLYHNDESAHGGVHRWRMDVPACGGGSSGRHGSDAASAPCGWRELAVKAMG